jgi:hypothetical protein
LAEGAGVCRERRKRLSRLANRRRLRFGISRPVGVDSRADHHFQKKTIWLPRRAMERRTDRQSAARVPVRWWTNTPQSTVTPSETPSSRVTLFDQPMKGQENDWGRIPNDRGARFPEVSALASWRLWIGKHSSRVFRSCGPRPRLRIGYAPRPWYELRWHDRFTTLLRATHDRQADCRKNQE